MLITKINSAAEYVRQEINTFGITRAFINQELYGLFGSQTLKDMIDTLRCYAIYKMGADFNADMKEDYVPADWKCKQIKALIDKEARFMFASSPDITIIGESLQDEKVVPNQELVRVVLEKNNFYSKLVKAAKDCLIGKRIAIVTNFNEKGIDVSFIPSLEFVYETDPSDVDILTKFIQFYTTVVNEEKSQQRVYRKKWELIDGACYVTEELYDGNGTLIETILETQKTLFSYIPVQIVINDGLVGDPFGVSEVSDLEDTESWYSKLSNKDIDSLRKAADQITYTMDVNPRTTKNLSRAAGAFWDLSSDPASDGKTGTVGTLDNSMSYSPALDTTLKRLSTSMHSLLDIPDTSNEGLQGIITSGKTMRAIYWGLMVRCDEKMLDWIPAIRNTVYTIIEGAKLYPESRKVYNLDVELSDNYTVDVVNNYPIMEDEDAEKATDIAEVSAKIRSRKSYMKKWMGLTDEQIDNELDQIALETQLLESDNFLGGEM